MIRLATFHPWYCFLGNLCCNPSQTKSRDFIIIKFIDSLGYSIIYCINEQERIVSDRNILLLFNLRREDFSWTWWKRLQ